MRWDGWRRRQCWGPRGCILVSAGSSVESIWFRANLAVFEDVAKLRGAISENCDIFAYRRDRAPADNSDAPTLELPIVLYVLREFIFAYI